MYVKLSGLRKKESNSDLHSEEQGSLMITCLSGLHCTIFHGTDTTDRFLEVRPVALIVLGRGHEDGDPGTSNLTGWVLLQDWRVLQAMNDTGRRAAGNPQNHKEKGSNLNYPTSVRA
jgi:hypothetical protein